MQAWPTTGPLTQLMKSDMIAFSVGGAATPRNSAPEFYQVKDRSTEHILTDLLSANTKI
jgi:hypothetical protein